MQSTTKVQLTGYSFLSLPKGNAYRFPTTLNVFPAS